MGKKVSVYLDDDALAFMDDIIKGLNEDSNIKWNRSELIAWAFKDTLRFWKKMADTPGVNLVTYLARKKMRDIGIVARHFGILVPCE